MIVTYTKKGIIGDLVIVSDSAFTEKRFKEMGYDPKDFIRKEFELYAEIMPKYTDHAEFHLIVEGE